MMIDEQAVFARAESIFAAVCDLPANERDAQIESLAQGDESVVQLVLSLIASDEVDTAPLDGESWLYLGDETDDAPDAVGDFDIVGVLGEGGMGIVYDAMQRSPRRRVALKIIKSSMMTPSALRRFEQEAEILAKLQHPGIATVFDSGVEHTASGPRPFVAMELVEGLPITQYASRHELDARACVELIRDVCRAVAHAHARGIIHRDLKPANVFVSETGAVKVLDFGVAFDTEVQQNTLLTQQGQLVGTLPYMAPEQVANDGVRADVRTDVYAIGLIAYELLTGVRPITSASRGAYELIRAIREDEPSLAGSINRSLRGDIEIIIAKAMDKVPDRRYATADELADDLDRHLASKPIIARKASTWYQLSRFAKRNPVVVGAVVTIFIVLSVAIVLITGALRAAQRDRDEARYNEYVSSAMNSFTFDDLFAAADPTLEGDPNITMLDAMRSAAGNISERFAESPEVEAELRGRIGAQFLVMNQLEEAKHHLEMAWQLGKTTDVDANTLIARLNQLSMLYSDTDELERAEATLDEADRLIETRPEVTVENRIDILVNRASITYHGGDIEGAAAVFEDAIAIGRTSAPDYKSTVDAIGSLGVVYHRLGRLDDAAALHIEATASSERLLGRHHPDTLKGFANVALLYISLERFDEAIELLDEVLTERQRLFGDDHVQTAVTKNLLGRAYSESGRFETAEGYSLDAYTWMLAELGETHRYTMVTRRSLCNLYTWWEKPEEASKYCE